MPQGKGTYGSKVGRPPKKKYQAGGITGKDDAAVLEAAQMGQELESIPLGGIESDFPTSNAKERSQVSPDTEQYKEGGKVKSKKVDVRDVVKSTGRRSKFYVKPEKQYFKGKEMKPVPLPSPKPSNQKAVPLPRPKLSDKEKARMRGLKMGKKK